MELRPFEPGYMIEVLPRLLPFLKVTLTVAFGSTVLGSLLGLLLAWAKTGGNRILKMSADIYTYAIRCTPPIVLLFIVFYGLPKLVEALFSYDLNDYERSFFAVITFTLLFGGYISEVFRAAYLAVPKGQYEAAVSVGLSPFRALLHVVFPQAAVIALPNFGNSVINILKEGALAYTIGLIDFIGRGNVIIAQNFGAYALEIYLVCLIVYWLMTVVLEQCFFLTEKKLRPQDAARLR